MEKQPPVYRLESWLERQVERSDGVGDYARPFSLEA